MNHTSCRVPFRAQKHGNYFVVQTGVMVSTMKRSILIGVVACLAYSAFAQEKRADLNVGSLSTQEIEEELQVSHHERLTV